MKRLTIDERIEELKKRGLYKPGGINLSQGTINIETASLILNIPKGKLRTLVRLGRVPYGECIPSKNSSGKGQTRDTFIIYKDKLEKYIKEDLGVDTEIITSQSKIKEIRKEETKKYSYKKNTVLNELYKLYEKDKKRAKNPDIFKDIIYNCNTINEIIEESIYLMEKGAQLGMKKIGVEIEEEEGGEVRRVS